MSLLVAPLKLLICSREARSYFPWKSRCVGERPMRKQESAGARKLHAERYRLVQDVTIGGIGIHQYDKNANR